MSARRAGSKKGIKARLHSGDCTCPKCRKKLFETTTSGVEITCPRCKSTVVYIFSEWPNDENTTVSVDPKLNLLDK